MSPMGETTRVLELASACQLPISAHLSLQLRLVLLDEKVSVLVRSESLFRPLDRGHLIIVDSMLFLGLYVLVFAL